jgi:hypothetical protein
MHPEDSTGPVSQTDEIVTRSVPSISEKAESSLHAELRALDSRHPRAIAALIKQDKRLARLARRRERNSRR